MESTNNLSPMFYRTHDFLLFIYFSFHLENQCMTPTGLYGLCISLLQCPSVFNVLTNLPFFQQQAFLRQYKCGLFSFTSLVYSQMRVRFGVFFKLRNDTWATNLNCSILEFRCVVQLKTIYHKYHLTCKIRSSHLYNLKCHPTCNLNGQLKLYHSSLKLCPKDRTNNKFRHINRDLLPTIFQYPDDVVLRQKIELLVAKKPQSWTILGNNWTNHTFCNRCAFIFDKKNLLLWITGWLFCITQDVKHWFEHIWNFEKRVHLF